MDNRLDICCWNYNPEIGLYQTECKNSYDPEIDGENVHPVEERGWIFCPYCGKEILVEE